MTLGPWATYASSQVVNPSSPWIWNHQNGGWPSRRKSVVKRSPGTPVRNASASPAVSCPTSRSVAEVLAEVVVMPRTVWTPRARAHRAICAMQSAGNG